MSTNIIYMNIMRKYLETWSAQQCWWQIYMLLQFLFWGYAHIVNRNNYKKTKTNKVDVVLNMIWKN